MGCTSCASSAAACACAGETGENTAPPAPGASARSAPPSSGGDAIAADDPRDANLRRARRPPTPDSCPSAPHDAPARACVPRPDTKCEKS